MNKSNILTTENRQIT